MPASPPTFVIEPVAGDAAVARVLAADGGHIADWVPLRFESTPILGRRLHAALDSGAPGEPLVDVRTPVYKLSDRQHDLLAPGETEPFARVRREQDGLTGAEAWTLELPGPDQEAVAAALSEEQSVRQFLAVGASMVLPVRGRADRREFRLRVGDAAEPCAVFRAARRRVECRVLDPDGPAHELILLPIACLLAELVE